MISLGQQQEHSRLAGIVLSGDPYTDEQFESYLALAEQLALDRHYGSTKLAGVELSGFFTKIGKVLKRAALLPFTIAATLVSLPLKIIPNKGVFKILRKPFELMTRIEALPLQVLDKKGYHQIAKAWTAKKSSAVPAVIAPEQAPVVPGQALTPRNLDVSISWDSNLITQAFTASPQSFPQDDVIQKFGLKSAESAPIDRSAPQEFLSYHITTPLSASDLSAALRSYPVVLSVSISDPALMEDGVLAYGATHGFDAYSGLYAQAAADTVVTAGTLQNIGVPLPPDIQGQVAVSQSMLNSMGVDEGNRLVNLALDTVKDGAASYGQETMVFPAAAKAVEDIKANIASGVVPGVDGEAPAAGVSWMWYAAGGLAVLGSAGIGMWKMGLFGKVKKKHA